MTLGLLVARGLYHCCEERVRRADAVKVAQHKRVP